MTVDEDFRRRTDPFRRELLAHCYQMLGSIHDAEDQVQDTYLRAWRAYDRFDERRASMRTWLYRIATNSCLTALEGRGRRALPSGLAGPGDDPQAALLHGGEIPWLQPFPDNLLTDDPAAVLLRRGRLRLAFVAAVQFLPPRQRAILILREVLDLPAADVAQLLDTTVAAVNSGLQRARARLAFVAPEDDLTEPSEADSRALVDAYVHAFVNADVGGLTKLLTAEPILEMPPMLNWYRGREHYADFMSRVYTLRGPDWRVLQTSSNGQPALAAYTRDPSGNYTAHSIQVLTVTTEGIARNTVFQDPPLFEHFALPRTV